MTLTEKQYNLAKWFVQVFLPAFGAFYAGLSQFAPVPAPLAVVGIASLVALFLGSILGISNAAYKKMNDPNAGTLSQSGVDPDTGMPTLHFSMNQLPEDVLNKDSITLKVVPASGPGVPPQEP